MQLIKKNDKINQQKKGKLIRLNLNLKKKKKKK